MKINYSRLKDMPLQFIFMVKSVINIRIQFDHSEKVELDLIRIFPVHIFQSKIVQSASGLEICVIHAACHWSRNL